MAAELLLDRIGGIGDAGHSSTSWGLGRPGRELVGSPTLEEGGRTVEPVDCTRVKGIALTVEPDHRRHIAERTCFAVDLCCTLLHLVLHIHRTGPWVVDPCPTVISMTIARSSFWNQPRISTAVH